MRFLVIILAAAASSCQAAGFDFGQIESARAALSRSIELSNAETRVLDTRAPDASSAAAMPEEREISRCPAGAEAITHAPDADLFTYIGFRYVRADNSTCEQNPGKNIYYQEPSGRQESFGNDGGPMTFNFTTPEYVVRRAFYFTTQLDGARRFYAFDVKQYTGKKIPESVTVSFPNRAEWRIMPWEKMEPFYLSYGNGREAKLAPGSTVFDYDIRHSAGQSADGSLHTDITAVVQKRRVFTSPEAGAVELSLEVSGGKLVALVRDSRADFYKGEQLGLRVKLVRDVMLLGDKVMYEMDVRLDSAAQLVLDFSDPRWDAFKKENLSALWPARTYYAEWSFNRPDSKISSGEWIPKGKTNSVKY